MTERSSTMPPHRFELCDIDRALYLTTGGNATEVHRIRKALRVPGPSVRTLQRAFAREPVLRHVAVRLGPWRAPLLRPTLAVDARPRPGRDIGVDRARRTARRWHVVRRPMDLGQWLYADHIPAQSRGDSPGSRRSGTPHIDGPR